jgi:hypothetical protein
VKEVRHFLGFSGYYRRFIKGFASKLRPLNNLLIGHPTKKQKLNQKKPVKKTPFKWEDEHQLAFEKVKEILTCPPILADADYSKPFKVTQKTVKALSLAATIDTGPFICNVQLPS